MQHVRHAAPCSIMQHVHHQGALGVAHHPVINQHCPGRIGVLSGRHGGENKATDPKPNNQAQTNQIPTKPNKPSSRPHPSILIHPNPFNQSWTCNHVHSTGTCRCQPSAALAAADAFVSFECLVSWRCHFGSQATNPRPLRLSFRACCSATAASCRGHEPQSQSQSSNQSPVGAGSG